MRRISSYLLFSFAIIINTSALAQSLKPIPDSLKVGADAVFRKYSTIIEYLSPSKYILKYYVEVTVLNERGQEHSDFYVAFDSDSPIKHIKADLFDANGKKVKTFSGKDIKEYSLYSGSNLYDDNRLKQVEVYYSKYPYTVVFEYIQENNSFINFPNWYPQIDYRVGVENATYMISSPQNQKIRYKLFNLGYPTEKIEKTGIVTYSWMVEGLKPIESEPYSPRFFETTPSIFIVPECFSYKGTTGCYNNWESYGTWVNQLLKDRSDLSLNSAEEVKRITDGIVDKKEKVKALYKFMQNRTRYVSIQLGIGGFQPFPASSVESTGYGDCKALVNYTKSLLALADIKSLYCEIGVENTKIMFDDFPSPDQTNHIILCVPLENDTVWLECTSQHMPFGYLPYNLQNQKVVLIDEEAGLGKIVKTPIQLSSQNKQRRNISLIIDSEGNGSGFIKTMVKGGEIENLFPELWQTDKEREEVINRKYNIPGFRLESFSYNLEESDTTKAHEDIKMSINKVASKTGDRLFIKVNPFGNSLYIPVKSKKRKFDLIVGTNRTHEDVLTYTIPDGYRAESLPKEVNINSKFGTIAVECKLEGNIFTYRRIYSISKQRHSAEEFNNFIDFLQGIVKADNQSLVLVKQ